MFALKPTRKENGKKEALFRPRWNRLREEMDTLFNTFMPEFREWREPYFTNWADNLEVKDAGDALLVRAEVPGFAANEVETEVSGNMLTIRASHKAEAAKKEKNGEEWTEREYFGQLLLPTGVNVEKAEAGYHNGVVTLKFPKTEKAKAFKIAVKE
jgi:HSP20 family protein